MKIVKNILLGALVLSLFVAIVSALSFLAVTFTSAETIIIVFCVFVGLFTCYIIGDTITDSFWWR